MENVRHIIQESYELDLAHYFSLPMLSLDAALKKTGIVLDHIQDSTLHCFIENSIRGGFVANGSIRSCSANNPLMGPGYDPNEPTSYIIYIDGKIGLTKYTHI